MPGKRTIGELAERILSADAPAVVVTGPPATGKTSAVLDVYRAASDELGASACLLIAPNTHAEKELRDKLLHDSPSGVLLSPSVSSFASLAGRILSARGIVPKPIDAFRRRLLLRRIVDKLATEKQFLSLQPVADTAGLIDALERAIHELKRAAIEPEDLDGVDLDDRHRDLLAVYRTYQAHLQRDRLYDVSGLLWQARQELADATDQPAEAVGLSGVEWVAFDGFTDFTPTQLAIARLLTQRGVRALVTLPLADDGRRRLWHWTRRTLETLRSGFGDAMTHIQRHDEPPGKPQAGPPMRPLWQQLFSRRPARVAIPAELSILSSAGMEAEVQAVARRVKSLLASGARPGGIAVLTRSMQAYRPAIDRQFARHRIPLSPAPSELRDVPVVRFVHAVSSLAGNEFAHADVLAVLRSSYLLPDALGDFDEQTVAVAEMLIRTANVLQGRDAYLRAARRLTENLPPAGDLERDPSDDSTPPSLELGWLRTQPERVGQAGELLDALLERSAAVRGPCDLPELVTTLDLHRAIRRLAEPDVVARDLRALEALQRAAGRPEAGRKLTAFWDALSAVTLPPARSERLVTVLDLLDARPMRFDHVFLLGVTEGVFPAPAREEPLLRESDRRRWAPAGAGLDARDDLAAREMLLMYLAISRADRTLTISTLSADETGRPCAPSPFLDALAEPMGSLDALRDGPGWTEIPLGRPLPPADELATEADALAAALTGLMTDRDVDTRTAGLGLAWMTKARPPQTLTCAAGLLAAYHRWSPGPCDRYDGRLDAPDVLAPLADHRSKTFSPSRLNTFGQCPWQYFARYVLRIQPLVEPQRLLEPVGRGHLCHDVLFRTLSDLADRFGRPLDLRHVNAADLSSALDAAMRDACEAIESRRPPYPAVWAAQQAGVRADVEAYLLAQQMRNDLPSRPTHFELSFGFQDIAQCDPASTADHVELTTPGGPLRLHGRIDRVDVVDTPDGPQLLAVDYKTGRLPTGTDITEGRSVQAPLYALAAGHILDTPPAGGAYHRIGADQQRTFARFKPSSRGVKEDDTYDQQLDELLATLSGFIDDMSSGRFDVAPTHHCPSYCPYRRICHYAPARARLKTDDPEAGP